MRTKPAETRTAGIVGTRIKYSSESTSQVAWWAGKAKAKTKQHFDAAGIRETKQGVYDTRDWNAIRSWAEEIVQKVRP